MRCHYSWQVRSGAHVYFSFTAGHIDILSREFVAIGKKALEPAPNLIGATLAKRSLSSRADLQEEEVSRHSISIREDWEDDALIRDGTVLAHSYI